jgi:hypothetical protein
MKYSSRILSTFLVAVLGFNAGAPSAAETEAQPAFSAQFTVVGGTEQDQAAVDWATKQYRQADLELPQLVIEFHGSDDGCDGYDGVFRGARTPAHIDVCNHNRYIVLHELAHAWDRHNLTDETREAFLEQRGLTEWNGSRPWKQRGVEALAEIVTWGLRDNPLTEDADEKLEAYQLITGRLPQRHATEVDTGAYRAEDPLDVESGWDELR